MGLEGVWIKGWWLLWSFNIDVLIPLGLILNELISNSFKHAFSNNEHPCITIELKKTIQGKHEFIYTDNGIGIEMETAIRKKSMGMMLLELLGEQLEGKYSFESENGFRYVIEFWNYSRTKYFKYPFNLINSSLYQIPLVRDKV